MSEPIIQVRRLGKRYRLGQVQRYRTLRESLRDAAARPVRRLLGRGTPVPPREEFWALRDVSFDVRRGEVLGIIGRNGAGKSTLLKILSRITEPTEGAVEIVGRVASLLEVGTGFHPELSGRENIYLNGAILGMSGAEIRRKFDEIVAFAEVEKFLDTPVKHYSSGMYTRLAFAVAAHLEPEILVVDEVLAVGDAQFQKKCMGKMGDVAKQGRTVLFVSHNMPALANLCSRAILLNKGRVVMEGPAQEVVNHYVSAGRDASGEVVWGDPASAPGSDRLKLHAVRILSGGQPTADVEIHKEVRVRIDYWNLVPGQQVSVSFHVLHQSGVIAFVAGNASSPHAVGLFGATATIPGRFLNDGFYGLNLFLLTEVTRVELSLKDVAGFTVHDTGATPSEFLGQVWGVVRPTLSWAVEPLAPEPDDAASNVPQPNPAVPSAQEASP